MLSVPQLFSLIHCFCLFYVFFRLFLSFNFLVLIVQGLIILFQIILQFDLIDFIFIFLFVKKLFIVFILIRLKLVYFILALLKVGRYLLFSILKVGLYLFFWFFICLLTIFKLYNPYISLLIQYSLFFLHMCDIYIKVSHLTLNIIILHTSLFLFLFFLAL